MIAPSAYKHGLVVTTSCTRTATPGGAAPRIVDDQLAEALATAAAVVLEGPKACGKTDTVMIASVVSLGGSGAW